MTDEPRGPHWNHPVIIGIVVSSIIIATCSANRIADALVRAHPPKAEAGK